MPFFSVIIPTFNRADRLHVAIKSVLSQQFTDYELIIVDDGSTDNTKEIVDNFGLLSHKIVYFYKENEERSIARNYGIHKGMGRYVCFMDSDDRMYSNHLEVAYKLLTRENYP